MNYSCWFVVKSNIRKKKKRINESLNNKTFVEETIGM